MTVVKVKSQGKKSSQVKEQAGVEKRVAIRSRINSTPIDNNVVTHDANFYGVRGIYGNDHVRPFNLLRGQSEHKSVVKSFTVGTGRT